MPTWGGILKELQQAMVQGAPPPFDLVRRKYLTALHAKTGRPVILYASKFTQEPGLPPDAVSIVDEDLQGLMEVINGVAGPSLDLILHSPGGSAVAAEGFVMYLRSKFTDVRVIVPQLAMSAATMLACSANRTSKFRKG